jgi:hypothetical protein
MLNQRGKTRLGGGVAEICEWGQDKEQSLRVEMGQQVNLPEQGQSRSLR